MTTLADVAALAGVSKSTASRALARSELVAPETVARVREAAQRLDFIPNRAASQLARGRTGLVALVVPTLENSFFTPIIAGAQERAAESDLQLTVAVHPLQDAIELVAFERLAQQVDGFILVAPRGADELVRAAGSIKPTVLVDREVETMASVVADTATAFGDLMARLVAAGHRSVAYIGGPEGSWQNEQRIAAVRRAVPEGVDLALLGPHPASFAAGMSAAEDLAGTGATAVVPYATAIGMGVMMSLRARGIASPGEVLVSAERTIADALGADIPAIDVDGLGLGREAMALLDPRIGTRPPAEPVQRRLPVAVHWHDAARGDPS